MALWAVTVSSLCCIVVSSGRSCEGENCKTQYAGTHLLQMHKGESRATFADDPSLPYNLTVLVQTSQGEFSGTETGALISFEVDGTWTADVELLDRVPNGGLVNKTIILPVWPQKLKISAGGQDSWSYDSIDLGIPGYNVNVFNIDEGVVQSIGNVVDAGVDEIESNIYLISPLPPGFGDVSDSNKTVVADSNKTVVVGTVVVNTSNLSQSILSVNCTTRKDERDRKLLGFGSDQAPPGTPCIFGVDSRDEGAHCIDDNGEYGEMGWCYTDAKKRTWGSCDENCPLWGQEKIIGDKLDRLLDILDSENSSNQNLSNQNLSITVNGNASVSIAVQTAAPTSAPTAVPAAPTSAPTAVQTHAPTARPTAAPTSAPTASVCAGCSGCQIFGSCNTVDITTAALIDEDRCVNDHNGTWCAEDGAINKAGGSGSGSDQRQWGGRGKSNGSGHSGSGSGSNSCHNSRWIQGMLL